MQQDEILAKTETEVLHLQEKLKDRLKEAQDLSDLTKKVQDSSFQLEKSTSQLKESAEKAKWKILLEYWWMISVIGLFGLALIYLIFIKK